MKWSEFKKVIDGVLDDKGIADIDVLYIDVNESVEAADVEAGPLGMTVINM